MFEVKNLDWLEILEKIQSFATSENARVLLTATRPLKSAIEAEKSFYEIEAAAQVILSGVRPQSRLLHGLHLRGGRSGTGGEARCRRRAVRQPAAASWCRRGHAGRGLRLLARPHRGGKRVGS